MTDTGPRHGPGRILRWRPLVFVSSSIRGFERQRQDIEAAIELLDVADAWRFESSATASGSTPDTQYLPAARDSDIFVLIVTADIRSGTIDEYDAAFADNADKILPFLLGEQPDANAEFRDILRARHTTSTVSNDADLPAAIAGAVNRFVESGAIAKPGLVRQLRTGRDARRVALGVPLDLEVVRTLGESEDLRPYTELFSPGSRILLAGPPGTGKSDVGQAALEQAADNLLPIYARARPGVSDVKVLIADAMNGAKFSAGSQLIEQYLRDGALAVMIDGLDELPSDDRAVLLADVQNLALTYPRTSILVPGRVPPPAGLEGFETAVLSPLRFDQVDAIFQAFGYDSIRPTSTLDEAMSALVEIPFWTFLVAQFGRSATSALDLLRRLVDRRLTDGLREEGIRQARTREAFGSLAWSVHPSVETDVDQALTSLMAWIESNRSKYERVSAEQLLEDGRKSGLVTVEGLAVRFPHSIVAAYLSAEHLTRSGELPTSEADETVIAMLAGLLSHADDAKSADLLALGGLVVVAQFLRLTGPTSRVGRDEIDLTRFDRALAAYRGATNGSEGAPIGSQLMRNGDFVCIRQAPGVESSVTLADNFSEWVGRPGDPISFLCWRQSPFESMTPEYIAATLILVDLKKRVELARPPGDQYAPFETDTMRLASSAGLQGRLLEFVLARNRARSDLISTLRLTDVLDVPNGEPLVSLRIGSRDARFVVSWGHPIAQVKVEESDDLAGDSIREIAADVAAVAYQDLVGELEKVLASPISSHAVRNPSVFGWSL